MKKRRDRSVFSPVARNERGPSQRQLRVGEELRHALAKLLIERECRDPALENVSITVTEVRISPDLRNATAFVMPLAGTNAGDIVAALQRCAPHLKGLLGRQLSLRNTPNLGFALDNSFDQAQRISALLMRPDVARDLQPQVGETEDHGR